jgi:hypothetical protein
MRPCIPGQPVAPDVPETDVPLAARDTGVIASFTIRCAKHRARCVCQAIAVDKPFGRGLGDC